MTKTNLTVAMFVSGAVLLTGCAGGASSNGGVAHLGSDAGTSTLPGQHAARVGSPEATALEFAGCMRANGVPNFPDPSADGGFRFQRGAGVDPSAPAFMEAQAKCRKFMPNIGAPGSGPPPSAQAVAKMLKISQCMRSRGIAGFPDPRTSLPSNPRAALGSGGGVISDIEGVILVFPGTIDQQSALFTRAAAACEFPLHNH